MKPIIVRSASFIALLTVLFCAPRLSFAEPHVFPNPFIAKDHAFVRFTDLPGPGSIRIFTVSGEKVADITIAAGEDPKKWDVVNSSGDKLATGVYLYLVDTGSQKTAGKIVVIR